MVVRLILAAGLIAVTLVVGGGVQAVLNVPDLQPWHRLVPRCRSPGRGSGRQIHAASSIWRVKRRCSTRCATRSRHRVSQLASQAEANRYQSASISSPRRASRDWNRTFELTPTAPMRGGALLIHGLTDWPYSMRAVADTLQAQGYYALALRMPGHGTVPGALTQATAEDWMAAVRMGARHVRRTIGADRPMVLVGYSNGGALVMRYALEATADSRLPAPSRLVLISPMIGVSPLARMARVISALGPLPFFEKARWLDVVPEYNPFKYNSFPANAANQSYRVSSLLRAEVAAAAPKRPDRPAAADPGVSVGRGRDREHTGGGPICSIVCAATATSSSSSTSTDAPGSSRISVPPTRLSSGAWPLVARASTGAR